MKKVFLLLMFYVHIVACSKSNTQPSPPVYSADTTVVFNTDKAVYKPGDRVNFTIDKSLPSTAKIRCRQLSNVITETTMSGQSWQWTAPSNDFTGYMIDVYNTENGGEKVYGSIAVDVSSDWSHFPRYGFLSSFGNLTNQSMDSVMNGLNRLHVNGLQFYDWDYEHHQPLAGTVSSPATSWKDIANRDTYKSTINYYIASAHSHNMLAMSYNLCYGALNDAAAAGVSDQWYMYTDQLHQTKSVLSLGSPFKSNIYLVDPSNTSWQQYIASKTQDVYNVYSFDGYHVDQLGDWGTTFNYSGSTVNVPAGFNTFLNAMKTASSSKRLVMNAVNQYGQQNNIAAAPVDFLYTEVWAPNESYNNLSTIITNNNTWSNYTKKTVLAAYMNQNLANSPGYFNTPGVLFADAVIFSFGGSHLEMGEHMLCNQYFPFNNLQMKADLQQGIVHYYDFLTGYENLLRDGGSFNNPNISPTDGKTVLSNWPPQTGSVSVIGKDMGTKQVIHLINFANASSFDWRDASGNQSIPKTFTNISYLLSSTKPVTKLWMASPDINGGALQLLNFTQSCNTITFTLPSLTYWDMLVAEY